jgi:hypothetical protein
LIETIRDKAKTALAVSDISKSGSMTLLKDYWASKSGLTPASKYSMMDHVRAAGKIHYFKDVT